MKITNCGRGPHQREVKGIERLQQELASSWYAYTNLELATSPGEGREIDVVLITDDRIFVVDLKDWKGPIESQGGRWLNGGRDSGPSPVAKLSRNARDIFIQLQAHLRKHAKAAHHVVPKVQSMVVLTRTNELSGIAATEVANVMLIDHFIESLKTRNRRTETFGAVHDHFAKTPLTSHEWKDQLSKFFNVGRGVFAPGRRDYGGFFATSDKPVFQHPNGIYSEFDASDERPSPTLGMLRLWDFTKAHAQFQTAEGRAEIAGREQAVFAYLRERSDRCDSLILNSRTRDPSLGVNYWEVFDRRRRLLRLVDFAATELKELGKADRLELARQLLSALDALHLAEAAHLDFGAHSIWVQRPSTIRLSHLMASSYLQVSSLGDSRYQFLSTGILPEDTFGEKGSHKQRDVFLAGLAVHRLLFGKPPVAGDGYPPEWDMTVDEAGEFPELHGWLAKALDWDPRRRFANAGEALSDFISATVQHPTPAEVIEGLEQHRGEVSSQFQLFSRYPPIETLRDDDKRTIWRSKGEDGAVLVKIWKRACWGDQTRDGPRILDFLDRLKEMAVSQPAGSARVLDAFWLGDAIVMVQEWIDRPDLEKLASSTPGGWSNLEHRLAFSLAMSELVDGLHAQHLAHGDLKPANILVDPGKPTTPILIDLVDFANAADGEIRSSAYAPEVGGRFERDCFAVTRIVEELFERSDQNLPPRISEAIKQIRTREPVNSTLLPLIEALRSPPEDEEPPTPTIKVVSTYLKPGPLLPDQGRYYLRKLPDRAALSIRGACEELQIEIDVNGRPYRIRRFDLDQWRISALSKHEFGELKALIEIADGPVSDFLALTELLERQDVAERLAERQETSATPVVRTDEGLAESVDEDEEVEDSTGEELAADELNEVIAAGPRPTGNLDVASLWERLIEAEKDLVTYGEASEDSTLDSDSRRHMVPFDLLGGSFDYDRRDRVLVERQDGRGQWRAIAHLDVQRSKPHMLYLDAVRFDPRRDGPLVRQEDRIRFKSRFEQVSLDRRHSAVMRITRRNSRTRDLIDIFDPRFHSAPRMVPENFKIEELRDRYGLNPLQAKTLAAVLSTRPLALVQGPPGTGKTVFIAALVHAALTSRLVRNVLLASQSHEAVNNAAESVLKLFSKAGEAPSIIRVGNENVVSDHLLPFHAARVEQLYKDRFQAEMRERLGFAAEALGISDDVAAQLMHIELAIRPVVRRLGEIEETDDARARENALRYTLSQQLVPLGLEASALPNEPAHLLVEKIVDECLAGISFERRPSPDKVSKLQDIAALARDFVASVSTEQRSFETFLAGTRQIVTGTCVGLGRSSLGLTTTAFDLVVVDEAARCTASELAVPMQAGSWIVLVGDHKQLEPQLEGTIVKDVAKQIGVELAEVVRSDFERIFETAYGGKAGHTLRTQYRMLPPIGDLVSSSFYPQSPLEHGRKVPDLDVDALPPELSRAITWVDTGPLGERARQSDPDVRKSLANVAEADSIVWLLKQWSECAPFTELLQKLSGQTHAIGIICGYAAQRDLIRRKIQGAPISRFIREALKVDTIDSYQGKQNPIVIVSLVRNNWDGPMQSGTRTIRPGFLATPNRINVALSRAMDRLVIVGSRSRWPTGSPVARIVDAFAVTLKEEQARVLAADELLSQQPEKVNEDGKISAGAEEGGSQ